MDVNNNSLTTIPVQANLFVSKMINNNHVTINRKDILPNVVNMK